LVHATHAVIKGKKYLCPKIIATVADNADHYPMIGIPNIGPREREVLRLIAEGASSPEIAKHLFIFSSTVDVHRRNIMTRLDLHSIAELTKYAVRNGLTPI
jgi:DNA-binding NarL/FixJ family response regulator